MKWMAGAGIAAVIVVGGVFTLGPAIARTIVFKKKPELAAMYEKWRNDKLHLPPKALEAKAVSPELQKAVDAFSAQWQAQADAVNAWIKEVYTKDMPETEARLTEPVNRAKLAGFAPLIAAFRAMVDQPGYEMAAMVESTIPPVANVNRSGQPEQIGIPVPNFLSFQNSVKLMCLQAAAERLDGRQAEALATLDCAARSARSHPYDLLITQLIAVADRSIATTHWARWTEQCQDPTLLRRALELQQRLTEMPQLLAHDMQLSTMENVAMLREVKRRGLEVDYQDRTGRELAGQSLNAQADWMERHLAGIDDAAMRVKAEQAMNGYRSAAAGFGGDVHGVRQAFIKLVSPMASPVLFGIAIPNFQEAHTRSDVSYNRFDLLRLATARKLYGLERGAAPADDAALVPAYLPELPRDRFAPAETPALRTAAGKAYSLGPDRKDDGGALAYDPTNGTLSAGDVWLPTGS